MHLPPPLASWRLILATGLSFGLWVATPAQASIFGVAISRLSYDIISFQPLPAGLERAMVTLEGSEIASAVIARTNPIPRGGMLGLLYDMGYACQPGFDPNTTLTSPNLYGYPKIALIQRGGPANTDPCTFRQKLAIAQSDGAVAAIIYNNPGIASLEGATAALTNTDSPVGIPGLIISYESGINLRSYLHQMSPNSTNSTSRLRMSLMPDQRMPVVWEFVLIVVIVLLGVSFAVSVILHCRLYALRQRVRVDALARGAEVMPDGTIRAPADVHEDCSIPKLVVSDTTNETDAEPTEQQPQNKRVIIPKRSRPNSIRHSLELQDNNDDPYSVPSLERHDIEISNDMCAICLDEFEEGDELRTLPCHHEFHCECIATPPEDEAQEDGTRPEASVPHDRLVEFIMGPAWVASQTRGNQRPETGLVSSVGNFLGSIYARLRGRSPTRQDPTTSLPVEEGSQIPSHQTLQMAVADESGATGVPAETVSIPLADVPNNDPTVPSVPPQQDIIINMPQSNSEPRRATPRQL
ncbi:E3 ubiquitin-protein ligase rnf13 [Podila epigama]|nr:E3 ubiquitin-protein ligase rnf13 [Podila epigama]